MSVSALEKAKAAAALKAQISTSAGYWLKIPAIEWFELLHAIDAVVAADQENRR